MVSNDFLHSPPSASCSPARSKRPCHRKHTAQAMMASPDRKHHQDIAESLLVEGKRLLDESFAGSAGKEKARHKSGPSH